jgi:glutaminase
MIGEEVHRWVGEEPSGLAFNAPVFDKLGRPHNPMVNAGAIMVCSLIVNQGKDINDLIEFYERASDCPAPVLDENLYQEEKLTGYNNHALTSLMLAKNCFPLKNGALETNKFT